MRIEIISGGKTSVHTMPEQIDFVGLTLENTERMLNIVTGMPDEIGSLQVECTDQEYQLAEGWMLTAHLYIFEGTARALSWKPYQDFLFYDLCIGGFRIKVYG